MENKAEIDCLYGLLRRSNDYIQSSKLLAERGSNQRPLFPESCTLLNRATWARQNKAKNVLMNGC